MKEPQFIIAGERRSGTTTLLRYVASHPDIYLHPRMDTAYFVDDALRSRKNTVRGKLDPGAWEGTHTREGYAALFEDASGRVVAGEKSADYLFWTPSHRRIKAWFPDVKWVLILRNPVDRAWSQYWNEVGKKREVLPFEEAIEREEQRIRQDDYLKFHLSYLHRGHYDQSLARLLEAFPRAQIHVIILERLIAEPVPVLQKLYGFLGVNRNAGLDACTARHNKNWTTFQHEFVMKHRALSWAEDLGVRALRKSLRYLISDMHRRTQVHLRIEKTFRRTIEDMSMKPETREHLQGHFLPHICATEDLIGRDLEGWRS